MNPTRRNRKRAWFFSAAALLAMTQAPNGFAQSEAAFRVLVYSKSPTGEGYVHTAAKQALKDSVKAWGRQYGFAVDLAEDASLITTANLAKYQTVIFNNVSAEVVDALPQASQKSALLEYMKTGGFVGLHAVTEAGRWPEMVSLLGAKMANHTSETNLVTATLNQDPDAESHPIITGMSATGARLGLASKIQLSDEWYTYTSNPRSVSGVKILYTLDEKTFAPAGTMGDHPITWVRTLPTGGRIFYSGIGHAGGFLAPAYTRNLFLNAIYWTAKMDAAAAIRSGARPPMRTSQFDVTSAEPSGMRVSVRLAGGYRLQVLSMDGKILAERAGCGTGEYAFDESGLPGPVGIRVISPAWQGVRIADLRRE
jgi:type 1 glutamine amidotransferase